MPPLKTTDKEVEVVTDQVDMDEKQQGTESSNGTETTDSHDEKQTESFDEGVERAAREAFEEATGTEASSTEEAEAKESDPKLGLDEKKEESTEEKEDPGTEETTEQDKGPVPYERFHEKVQQIEERDTKIKEWEPLVQNYQSIATYLQQNGVSPEEFNKGMAILAALKTDPIKAKELLTPYWNSVNTLDGSVLPPDLTKAVEDGVMDLKYAKELATFRAQSQLGKIQVQKSQEQLQEERINMFRQQSKQTLTSWIDSKKGIDPDFVPSKEGVEGDGKYELWLSYMSQEMPLVQKPEDIIKACEKCYARVSKTVTRFVPTKPTKKQFTSKHSSVRENGQADTIEDVVAEIANQHGIPVEASQLK